MQRKEERVECEICVTCRNDNCSVQQQNTTAEEHSCRPRRVSGPGSETIQPWSTPSHSNYILTNTGHLKHGWGNFVIAAVYGLLKEIDIVEAFWEYDSFSHMDSMKLGSKFDKHTLGKTRFWMYQTAGDNIINPSKLAFRKSSTVHFQNCMNFTDVQQKIVHKKLSRLFNKGLTDCPAFHCGGQESKFQTRNLARPVCSCLL